MYPYQPIINIAEICSQHGLKQVVLSPGSRCAPLTIAFARHPEISTYIIPDERSAAFIALGMAQQLNQPLALLCTSGSAGLNYYPAIAEAYYQQIPLLVLTADRPPEWIDQADGQTIRQKNMYANHIKANYELPVDYSHPDAVWQIERTINEAINLCKAYPPAPVHINLPFREPLYPPENFEMKFDKSIKIFKEIKSVPTLPENAWEEILEVWNQAEKVLVIGGQNRLDTELCDGLQSKMGIVLIADVISNLHPCPIDKIHFQDIFLANKEIQQKLGQADLLITFGKSVISKNLKLYLRNQKPKHHWHIQEAGNVPDTFKSLTKVIRATPTYFFNNLAQKQKPKPLIMGRRLAYLNSWIEQEVSFINRLMLPIEFSKNIADIFETSAFEGKSLSELEVVSEIIKNIHHANLHLANSMTVRYANYLQMPSNSNIEVFANRGTSGIDGCLSTAVGHALAQPNKMNVLIIGDLAFFYDRNGLWHNYLPKNLKIVVLNNHGGGIFKMIDAGRVAEADEYFVTKQALKAERTAIDAGIEYFYANSRSDFQKVLKIFLQTNEKAQLLEIETDIGENIRILNEYKKI
ncbi:MAG: 2-succinyl-5-enolpyruvyl-6-hydroxy-3-cyclohexene-1-carboxylic-acid synthase [Thermoflexibacter sp.]